jgi:hypothetical protein
MNTVEFGQKMNSMPKYVVSTTLRDTDAAWTNSTVIRDDVFGQLARLKSNVAGHRRRRQRTAGTDPGRARTG